MKAGGVALAEVKEAFGLSDTGEAPAGTRKILTPTPLISEF
jgi:hypothetical protein